MHYGKAEREAHARGLPVAEEGARGHSGQQLQQHESQHLLHKPLARLAVREHGAKDGLPCTRLWVPRP